MLAGQDETVVLQVIRCRARGVRSGMTILVSFPLPACQKAVVLRPRPRPVRLDGPMKWKRMTAKTDEITQEELSALLAKVAGQRDVSAFEVLFRHYAPRVKAYMARLARDGQAAEELMQETMVAVWNKASQFDPARGNVSAWVFTIARNQRIDAFRRMRRPAFDPADPAFVPDDTPGVDVHLEGQQEAARLRRAMAELPEEQRELLKESFFNDRSHSAIAETFGIPLGTVKSRIRLAFAKLRAALEDK
jgi:RNA polymerase sigma-70 factor (ECF subfamily)